MKMNQIFTNLKVLIYSTPSPSSLSYLWNFGSLLGLNLTIQLVSGILLATHYKSSIDQAFDSVILIVEDINWGWVVRSIHANGASLFFFLVYLHVGRGLYFQSWTNKLVWIVGVSILLILMATAFLGYVLPWGQMSLWGATVITNLLSAIPYIGPNLVEWVWGGFSVSEPTLVRFFAIHYLLPFILLVLVLFHVLALHDKGSTNPLGIDYNSDKVFFYPFFVIKDFMGVITCLGVFFSVSLLSSDLFMDPDNFIQANPLNTPPHIKPEWYFLFAYAILRSVPNKLGGVLALFSSIICLFFLSSSWSKVKGMNHKTVCVFFFMVFVLLTWTGGLPVEYPLTLISQGLSILYFVLISFFIFFPV